MTCVELLLYRSRFIDGLISSSMSLHMCAQKLQHMSRRTRIFNIKKSMYSIGFIVIVTMQNCAEQSILRVGISAANNSFVLSLTWRTFKCSTDRYKSDLFRAFNFLHNKVDCSYYVTASVCQCYYM